MQWQVFDVINKWFRDITKLLIHKGGNPLKARILVLAATGVAVVTVSGTKSTVF